MLLLYFTIKQGVIGVAVLLVGSFAFGALRRSLEELVEEEVICSDCGGKGERIYQDWELVRKLQGYRAAEKWVKCEKCGGTGRLRRLVPKIGQERQQTDIKSVLNTSQSQSSNY